MARNWIFTLILSGYPYVNLASDYQLHPATSNLTEVRDFRKYWNQFEVFHSNNMEKKKKKR